MSIEYPYQLPFYEPLENGPIAIAHRGGDLANVVDADGKTVQDKQNSIVAFESAVQAGLQYGETDAVATSDGVVMAFHGSKDDKQAKKTGLPSRGEIQSMTYSEVRDKVRIGEEPMPTMEELLLSFPTMRFFIDPKTNEVVKPLAQLIDKTKVHDRVSIGAFSLKRTKGVVNLIEAKKTIATTVGPLGSVALLASVPAVSKKYLKHSGVSGFALPYQAVNSRMVEMAYDLGMPLSVWTVNDEKSIRQSLEKGVNGVMSDKTKLVQDIVKSYGSF